MRPRQVTIEQYYEPAPVAGKFLPIGLDGEVVRSESSVGDKKKLATIFDFQSTFKGAFILSSIAHAPYVEAKVALLDMNGKRWYMTGVDFISALKKYPCVDGIVNLEYRFTAMYGEFYIEAV